MPTGSSSDQLSMSASSVARAPVGTFALRALPKLSRLCEQEQEVGETGVVTDEHRLVRLVRKCPNAVEERLGARGI